MAFRSWAIWTHSRCTSSSMYSCIDLGAHQCYFTQYKIILENAKYQKIYLSQNLLITWKNVRKVEVFEDKFWCGFCLPMGPNIYSRDLPYPTWPLCFVDLFRHCVPLKLAGFGDEWKHGLMTSWSKGIYDHWKHTGWAKGCYMTRWKVLTIVLCIIHCQIHGWVTSVVWAFAASFLPFIWDIIYHLEWQGWVGSWSWVKGIVRRPFIDDHPEAWVSSHTWSLKTHKKSLQMTHKAHKPTESPHGWLTLPTKKTHTHRATKWWHYNSCQHQ